MNHRYTNTFKNLLDKIDFETIENSKHAIYAISKNFELIYFNQAWFDFAKQNNGEPNISKKFIIGTNIFEGIKGIVAVYYLDKYSTVQKTLKPWSHEYQCSSNSTYREFLQNVYPLKEGSGLIIINSLKVEHPIYETENHHLSKHFYIQEDGFIVQCCQCRKTQNAKNKSQWDWVPSFVEKMPKNVSHSICPICFDYYYKK